MQICINEIAINNITKFIAILSNKNKFENIITNFNNLFIKQKNFTKLFIFYSLLSVVLTN